MHNRILFSSYVIYWRSLVRLCREEGKERENREERDRKKGPLWEKEDTDGGEIEV